VLEVSSPGVERPLRHAGDWRRFIGRDAVVTVDGEDGKQTSREIRIAGVEGEAGSETVVVEDAKGIVSRIQLAAVRKARLAFNWKR
jgi:ribosome maturation factor RimP